MLTDLDIYLFKEGTHARLFEKLGSHLTQQRGHEGTYFATWAPSASAVSIMGDFNGWSPDATPMVRRGQTGLFERFVPGVGKGARYKYRVVSQDGHYRADKADPFAWHGQVPPDQASIVWSLDHEFGDDAWMASREARSSQKAPIAIYEVHLGSWARDDDGKPLSYRDIAPRLAAYVKRMGFTHIELLPLTEHPFYGSWGYQATGYFAPTSRYGTPQDLMWLIDHMHQQGIAVILDWVPSHFPTDEHGLGYFDGTHLYEHPDPRRGYHPDWKSFIFDYGKGHVQSFLLSSALYWLERYHADGLRVDAVASMLYLDYSRKHGEWIPNEYGGRENIDAITFLRKLNEQVHKLCPGAQTFAEESTAWPLVSRPTYIGGLGFGFKWDMGWMNDILAYMQRDPIFRSYSHNMLTFRQMYASSEAFVLALSHDEVVHGKGSLLGKMPGDEWQRFANLRLLFATMYSQNGKKLLFMGGELAAPTEWNHDQGLDWSLEHRPRHAGVQRLVRDLNHLYAAEPPLHENDTTGHGFEWIDCSDADKSVVVFLRRCESTREVILVACNYTPVPRERYRVGLPYGGAWRELLNTDAVEYGGSGMGNLGEVKASPVEHHGRPFSTWLTLPPLSAVFFKGVEPPPEAPVEELHDVPGWAHIPPPPRSVPVPDLEHLDAHAVAASPASPPPASAPSPDSSAAVIADKTKG